MEVFLRIIQTINICAHKELSYCTVGHVASRDHEERRILESSRINRVLCLYGGVVSQLTQNFIPETCCLIFKIGC